MKKLIRINSCFGCLYQASGNKLAIAANGDIMDAKQHYCLKGVKHRIIDVDIVLSNFPEWCPLDTDLT